MKTLTYPQWFGALALAALFAFRADAGETTNPNPYKKSNDSGISISGTVVSPTDRTFRLDYGDGTVLVEMDDWDNYGEASTLLDGDRVTVFGYIDKDLFEKTSIEASSVYVESLNTFFYASGVDEEGNEAMLGTSHYLATPQALPGRSVASLRGTIASVNPVGRDFELEIGNGQRITVKTDKLGYNPLDKLGYQQLAKGDRVSVSGYFDTNFIEGRVFEAGRVVTLADAKSALADTRR